MKGSGANHYPRAPARVSETQAVCINYSVVTEIKYFLFNIKFIKKPVVDAQLFKQIKFGDLDFPVNINIFRHFKPDICFDPDHPPSFHEISTNRVGVGGGGSQVPQLYFKIGGA